METKLEWIAEAARTRSTETFTSLVHIINEKMLKACHKEMAKNRAEGADGVTKEQYEDNLEGNIRDLLARMKRNAYKPQPVKRVYIPKPGTDKKRPLGLPAYEDKLVQAFRAKILNVIYEQEFLDCSFGFRPQRSCHDALKVKKSFNWRRFSLFLNKYPLPKAKIGVNIFQLGQGGSYCT